MNFAAQQDLPPSGGFPQTIKYERYLPKRGPSGLVIFLGTFGIMGYGWYWLAQANAERRQVADIRDIWCIIPDNRWSSEWMNINIIKQLFNTRINVPLLQAETDRDMVRRLEAAKLREGEIMKNIPDWQPLDLKAPVAGIGKDAKRDANQSEPVYHTKRYVQPSFLFLPWESEERINAQWWRGSKMFLKNPPYHEREDWKNGGEGSGKPTGEGSK
ncbi:hypothetical protein SmJEL517_g02491 [Synchytrium microbalum]|uniref:NADH dehydrogenase [ubiquinone] 1 alpha subcomplex subunit 13 n=1 Tax=Synchytrium microbalum TaxID=1806994 RepID=A0A507C0C6_9FUNG|nr:uncharacterized protein SmJEL517_g02491 [Synchytrium microbalum]TPX34990.1 hypothetical protein SmJEL517_g02491 [Synchytrium microbalum]